ncbi:MULTISPECIES: type II toxin-antitoxin system VapC family toxin [Pedobacter]|uniref:PIN domain nuclease of toxin-antitoxin system n=1 Tax=Pedobacter alluvionis TaxID=475253 RepID=A0A497Y2C9_9SPHI|nr:MULTISPECIES: type II toxin-antitoxin system VapC family toxin [Pedobacter]QXU40421.1 type II toxin-antitoxin system VapC family toxin [Pedobacter sp. D749]RLJ76922.1 PIN domain nuclease of toxin-antitoxin system [Pedobacter alluvionis]TFB33821.1 type II toxin-antitoxin system VapC family toxin [Pedobacter alluvionis]
MAYLLDTHTFLWFVAGDSQLPISINKKLSDINQSCFLSIASLWEIAIKKQIGKLDLKIGFEELFRFAERNQIEIVSINETHLTTLLNLEFINNDPFDRIIVSQAISENLTLISRDKKLKNYKVKLQWD